MMKKFTLFREERESKTPISSKIKLQKQEGSPEFQPFRVDKATRPNLRSLIQAFKGSGQVGLGFTTIDKSKGEHEPVMKSKNLWLTGGAVRDHLKGKTPKGYDLVTDATPSEIRMILSNCEQPFTEIKPKDGEMSSDDRYADLPSGNKRRSFHASRWDGQGKEIEITVEINGEKFELATLGKHGKSRRVNPEKTDVATSVEEDSMGRDFTMNAMYIPLTQSDGENSDLIDPHGGAHHLKSGEVKFINSPMDKMRDDPMTAFRYLNTAGKYGKLNQIGDKEKAAIGQFRDMSDVDPSEIRKSFLGGLEDPDTDARQYMGAAKDLGLLNVVFPNLEFKEDPMPPDFRGDRWLAPAWILRDNDPEQIKKTLSGAGWSKQEAADIAHLVKIAAWAEKDGFNPEKMKELKGGHTGLTKSKIREWLQMINKGGEESEGLFRDGDDEGQEDKGGKPGMGGERPEAAEKPGMGGTTHKPSMSGKSMGNMKSVNKPSENAAQNGKSAGGDEGGESGPTDDKEKKENTMWGKMLNKIVDHKMKRVAELNKPTNDGWVPLLK